MERKLGIENARRGEGRRIAFGRNVSDVKRSYWRTSNGCPKGVNGNMLYGTCHFEARPWGGLAYHRTEIFQQTSLSFHLPNADSIGPTPGRMVRTVMPPAITASLFFTLVISTAQTSITYANASIALN